MISRCQQRNTAEWQTKKKRLQRNKKIAITKELVNTQLNNLSTVQLFGLATPRTR